MKKELQEIIKSSVLEWNPPEWNFDFRPYLLSGRFIELVAIEFWSSFSHLWPFQVYGMEFSGLPMALGIQEEGRKRGYECNVIIYRKSKKSKTNGNLIEGFVSNHPIIFIDDILSSGESVSKAIHELKEIEKEIVSSFFIIDFQRNDATINLGDIERYSMFFLTDFGIEKFEEIE